MNDDEIIVSKTQLKEPEPNPELGQADNLASFLDGFRDREIAVVIPEEPTKKKRGRPSKISDLQVYNEEALLDNAEDLTLNLYEALNTMLKNIGTYDKPNPKFIELAAQLIGVLKQTSQVSINNTNINSGNTNLLHATGSTFEKIADSYHLREREGLNEEFMRHRLNKPPLALIEAEIIEPDKDS